MVIAAIILGILLFIYIMCLRGRGRNPDVGSLRGWSYAHRGLHKEGIPENSMAAFRLALLKGYGIELDVHLMADGNLAVVHDSSLLRTTGQEGRVEELTLKDLHNYTLEGTEETIPTLREVLNLVRGKAPIIVELKSPGRRDVPKLCQAVCDLLEDYEGDYCIESFDPLCLYWFKKNRPAIVRGQLTANYMKEKAIKSRLTRVIMTCCLGNWLTTPDFIAYEHSGRHTLSNFLVRYLWGVQGVTWTLRTQEDYDKAVREGWIPIFEGFEP